MGYVFDDIDIHEQDIANEYGPPGLLQGMDAESLYVEALAVFRDGDEVLPLSYDAVTALLRLDNSDLRAVNMRKEELMRARNAFVALALG